MRQDVSWVQERMRLMQLAQGCHSGNGGRSHQLAMPRDWDNFHREVLELLNPCRAKKLTKLVFSGLNYFMLDCFIFNINIIHIHNYL